MTFLSLGSISQFATSKIDNPITMKNIVSIVDAVEKCIGDKYEVEALI